MKTSGKTAPRRHATKRIFFADHFVAARSGAAKWLVIILRDAILAFCSMLEANWQGVGAFDEAT